MAAEIRTGASAAEPRLNGRSLIDGKLAAIQRLTVHAVRRLGWGVADQGISSLTNYAVSLYVVHSLGAVQFGAFSLAYLTYGFVLNGSRGLCTDPMMIRYSGVSAASWRNAAGKSTGTAVAYGVATGTLILLAVATRLLSGSIGGAFLALGLTLPFLMLQDCWRYAFFTAGRGFQAFLNDSVWAVTLIPALILLKVLHHADVFWFTFAWGGTAGIAAIAGVFQARLLPRPTQAWDWLARQGDLGFRYFVQGLLGNVAFQVRGIATGAMIGLAVVGYVQASVTLMGPMTILFLGMALVTIPEAGRVLRNSPAKLPQFAVLVSGGLTIAALGWGALLLIAVPRGLGAHLLGPIWPNAYTLIVPQLTFVLAQAVATGSSTGINAMGAARRSLWVSIVQTVLSCAFTLAGAYIAGGAGTIYGMALASWIGTGLSWWQFKKALQDSGILSKSGGNQLSRPFGRRRKMS
jgi:O-antigen/teichoic acid export membrane protein